MTTERVKRKLSAILSADVAGYSRLMSEDEVATVNVLKEYREVMATLIHQYEGRVVDTPGDNLLAEFESVVDAVQCAVEIQKQLKVDNERLPQNRRMEFRIGVNLGDLIREGDRIYGDGVNIAARMEGLAEAGGICMSGTVYDQVKNKLDVEYKYIGEQTVKNIPEPARVYRVLTKPEASGKRLRKGKPKQRKWRRIAMATVIVFILVVGAGLILKFYLSPLPSSTEFASERKQARAKLKEIKQELKRRLDLHISEEMQLPDKPSIAVLPFVNMSDDPKQEYFSDGITEDLITDLSKISGLLVIARNSTFTYKGKAVKIEQISRELGVRYILEGSVRKADKRIRINAQLIDSTTGGHVWAERYDRKLSDVFGLQDEVTQKIVSALAVKLTEDEQQRVTQKETDNLEAYDYVLRGVEYFPLKTKDANTNAQHMFVKAIELDPEYASAYAWLAQTYLQEWIFGWGQGAQSLDRALELAKRALALDGSVALGYCTLGDVYLWKKQHDRAIAELEKAIDLDPNGAQWYSVLGDILSWSGRPEDAIPLIKKAMRLNPKYSSWHYWNLGHAYFLTARYEDAIVSLKETLKSDPDSWPSHAFLAISYGKLGLEEEARAEAKETLRLNPNLSLDNWRQKLPYRDQYVLESVLEAFRKVGLK